MTSISTKLLIAKAVTAVVCFLLSVLGSFAPWIIGKMQNNHDYLFSLLNCLAGGVAIGVAFSHLLPDAVSSLAAAWPNITYPYAYLIATASLLLLYSIDLVASDFHPHTHDTAPEHKQKKKDKSKGISTPIPASESTPLMPGSPSPTPITLTPSPEDVRVLETPVKGTSTKREKHDGDGHKKKKKKHPVINAYVFLAGITVHSLFEGLGLGAEASDRGVYSVIIAVMAHKGLEAFALGLSIYRAEFHMLHTAVLLMLYSLATPLGITLGIILKDETKFAAITGILVSLATGSFLYISLLEILPTELAKPRGLKWKLLLVYLGWGSMALLARWI